MLCDWAGFWLRSARRCWLLLVWLLALGWCLSVTPGLGHAATFTVTTTEDNLNADGLCTLQEAMLPANDDPSYKGGITVRRVRGTTRSSSV